MIGGKVRSLRVERGLTIEQLAQASGLTTSFISQVERSVANLSLTSLRQICRALDVPMFQVFLNGQDADEYITRKGFRTKIRFPEHRVQYELLSPSPNSPLQVMEVVLGPGEVTAESPMAHRGEEITVVLSGEVRIVYGMTEQVLRAGDAIHIVSTIPHSYANRKRGNARLLMAILSAFPGPPAGSMDTPDASTRKGS
jgi:transcriptional regulator with XRE-family HTH domain